MNFFFHGVSQYTLNAFSSSFARIYYYRRFDPRRVNRIVLHGYRKLVKQNAGAIGNPHD